MLKAARMMKKHFSSGRPGRVVASPVWAGVEPVQGFGREERARRSGSVARGKELLADAAREAEIENEALFFAMSQLAEEPILQATGGERRVAMARPLPSAFQDRDQEPESGETCRSQHGHVACILERPHVTTSIVGSTSDDEASSSDEKAGSSDKEPGSSDEDSKITKRDSGGSVRRVPADPVPPVDSLKTDRVGPPMSQMAMTARLGMVRRRKEIADARKAAAKQSIRIPRRAITFSMEVVDFQDQKSANCDPLKTPGQTLDVFCRICGGLKEDDGPSNSPACALARTQIRSWTNCSIERAALAGLTASATKTPRLTFTPTTESSHSHLRRHIKGLENVGSPKMQCLETGPCPFLAQRVEVSEWHVRFRVVELH